MKTLTDYTIIYDDECPMCARYTSAFITAGLLDKNGRETYSDAVRNDSILEVGEVDWDKARNEIALVNKKDGQVIYGIDSLTKIIGHSFSILIPFMDSRIFLWVMTRFYAFISYNRKVIIPGETFEGKDTCTPDFNHGYRWAYIVLAWGATSFILFHYVRLLTPLVPESNFIREFIICGGQILFQGVIVLFVKKDRWVHYLGNVMTVSLFGALLLIPGFMISNWISSHWFFTAYFMVVVSVMVKEHIRRVKILELPSYLTATWLVYRLLILGIVL